MNIKQAIKIANQFNDTIFTNTPKMVEAVEVLVNTVEKQQKKIKNLEKENFIYSTYNDQIEFIDSDSELLNRLAEERAKL